MLSAIVLICFVGTAIFPLPPPTGGSVAEANQPLFSPGHFLGTDLNGNDTLSRVLHGGRTSLSIAIAVNVLGLLLGGLLGSVSGILGGVADAITMRLLDVFIAFPSLILVITISQALGPSEINTVFALTFYSIPAFARIARAGTLRLRERLFITAAVLSGFGTMRILLRHVAPNVVPQLGVFALLGMGVVMIIEGALTFLGLGVPPPQPTWGNMILHGQQALLTTVTLVAVPSTCLFVTVLSFNLLGEAMRARWSRL
jgi:peptide/nickel transport system permease protein